MPLKIAVIMDPIDQINLLKDSTYRMLVEAHKRGHTIHYLEQAHMFARDGLCFAEVRTLDIKGSGDSWYQLGKPQQLHLGEMDLILMRKDPPFDMEFVYSTYLLDLAEQAGALVVNKPASLRNANEKFFTQQFPQCCCPTLVSRRRGEIMKFFNEHEDIIVKPLDGMGGSSIFRLKQGDPNLAVILETITDYDKRSIMAQRYIPEISQGDKRILVVNGKPVPFSLARIPKSGETRGNLAAGGRGVVQPLTKQDQWICEQLAPRLVEMGLYFVGLDVIGNYLTEINITSPTCIQEIERESGLNIAKTLLEELESLRHAQTQ